MGNSIHWFCCFVAATVLGIGVADYLFSEHRLTVFLSWAVLAAIPWLVGRASLFVLALGARSPHKVKNASGEARGGGGLGTLRSTFSGVKSALQAQSQTSILRCCRRLAT